MRVAVLSDIHGNYEALQAAVTDLDSQKPDRVICLGDMIGYGPDPGRVVQLVRQRGFECLVGNHEAGVRHEKYRSWMNFQAVENNRETEGLLSAEDIHYLGTLPDNIVIDNMLFVHGFPPRSFLTYLRNCSDKVIRQLFAIQPYQFYFVGHTHTLSLVCGQDDAVDRMKLECGQCQLDSGKKYIVNCGSVGQPRDRDNRAKYILFDTATCILDVVALSYDYEKTIRKIEKLGFPAIYGSRLR